jgi:alpha-L-fucosidase
VAELKQLRFGMFICWSFSTFSGKEWTPGITNLDLFHPTGCDVEQWVKTAKEAGMGYVLFLTKHHDGFCLWDTQTTGRKVTRSVLGRDVLRQLRQACDSQGIKLALYFSEGEWAWPSPPDGKRPNNGGCNPQMKQAQLKELLTQYGPIEFIWFDNAVGDGGLGHEETVAFCKALQPRCFIGFNGGPPAGDIRLGEMGRPAPLAEVSGAGFNSAQMAGYKGYQAAEFTYPILPSHQDGAMWFYSLPKHDQLCLPAEKIYADYLGAAKYGNIFSLDVGPNYEGRLRDIDVQTLRKVGQYIRGELKLPPMPVSQGKPARASSVWQNSQAFSAAAAVDGDTESRWGGAENSRSGWVEVDLETATRIRRAVVMELAYPRTRKFAIEYKHGETWKELVHGTTIAGTRAYQFEPVTARYVRLNIIEAAEVPTIEEFQLFQ